MHRCCLLLLTAFVVVDAARSPVILIPGDGGNQLWAKLNLNHTSHVYCSKKTSDFFLLWANIDYFIPLAINCFVDIIRLERNPVTGMTFDPPGVAIKVPGWGGTESVEWLSNWKVDILSYYHRLVKMLVSDLGYSRGSDVRGAPYDFRKAPNELAAFYLRLKGLIEEAYSTNSLSPVVLVCHSLGCPNTLTFLHGVSASWKAKYIRSLVSVAGAYGGAAMALKAFASGDTLGIPTIKPLWVRPCQRTWPSSAYLLPKLHAFDPHQVLAMTDRTNYSLSNLHQFFKDMNYSQGFDLARSVANLTDITRGPGVPVFCVLTKNTTTGLLFDWRGRSWPNESPAVISGPGDGTVNWESLALCPEFAKTQSQAVTTHFIEGVNHLGILRDQRFTDFVRDHVLS